MASILFDTRVDPRDVQIDAALLADVEGLVAGVRDVPVGPHRLSILSNGHWRHEWLHVLSDTDELSLVGDHGPADPARRSGTGRGSVVLAPFPTAHQARWGSLTVHLREHGPNSGRAAGAGRSDPSGANSGITFGPGATSHGLDALLARAGGPSRLMSNLEQTFLDGFLTPDTGDGEAIASWRRLVSALAGAGGPDLRVWPGLLVDVVATLEAQIAFIGLELLDDSLVYELDLLCEELVRAPDPGLGLAGLALGRVLGPAGLG